MYFLTSCFWPRQYFDTPRIWLGHRYHLHLLLYVLFQWTCCKKHPRAIFCDEIKERFTLCMAFWIGQACCSSWAVSERDWHNSGLAEKAQLGVNAERQWHRVNNSTCFCWTCHSSVHSCEKSLGTIWMLFVFFWPIFGTAFTKPLWEG